MILIALAFGILITIHSDKEAFGFSTFGVIGACSGLFFTTLLANVQVREAFDETSIVYIEYFYYLIYIALLFITINAYLFSLPNRNGHLHIVDWCDNLLAKVLYWPLLLGTVWLISYWVL